MEQIIQKKIIVNGLLINYYVASAEKGNTHMVFLHGWLSNSKVWFHLMHALSKIGVTSIAVDLPGFGESQIPEYSFNNDFNVEIINEFTKKLNIDKFILVGHSNGGAIAAKYSVKYPLNIIKLILIDAAGIRLIDKSKRVKNSLAKIFSPLFKFKSLKPLRRYIYKWIGSEDYINSEYLKGSYKNIIAEDISSIYKKIAQPTLIVWGKKDKDTPYSYAEFINSQIPDSTLVTVDAAHFPFLEKPNEVINHTIKFIK